MNVLHYKQSRTGWGARLLNTAMLLILILSGITPYGAVSAQTQPLAQLITNGDFSNGSAGWEYSGSVTFTSGRAILDGSAAPWGTIMQTVPTVAGNTFTLEYDQSNSGGQPSTTAIVRVTVTYFDVELGRTVYLLDQRTNATTSQGVVHNTFTLVGTGAPVTIRFIDSTGATYRTDVVLDNISFTTPDNTPVAYGDSYSTGYGAELTIAAPGVLVNDIDADSDPLTVVKASEPANGVVTLNSDGSFAYTPNTGFSGQDSFTYQANDRLVNSEVATVTIDVSSAPNTAPEVIDDSYSTDFELELTIPAPGVLGNDTDADGNPLTALKVSEPANGIVTLNADGLFTYTPDAGFSGLDSFTYKANDGIADSNEATVTIDVFPPVNDSNLVGYWMFDEASGATAIDSSGWVPANTGMLSGGAAFTTSAAPVTNFANPGALSVSGASASLVSVPNSAINKLTNNFTVMGWINPSSLSGVQRVISTARTTSGGWGFGLNAGYLYFSTYGVKNYLPPSSSGMQIGQWYHIAAVLDSNNAVTYYINGIPTATVTHTAPGIADTNDILQIGASTTNGASTLAESFNGLIDDVRVYNTALTAAQIADAVGVDHCSELVLRARVMLGEKSGTVTLENGCTYTISSVGDTANGGSGIKVSTATKIEGNGATIERNADAAQKFRVMTTSPAITINNLTVRGGSLESDSGGAGLLAFGSLTLNNVRFENNTAANQPGSIYVTVAGAVKALGNLTVDRSIFLGNQSGGFAGAIQFGGTTGRITNSIFANNASGASGAAVRASSTTGSLTILNNTFTDAYHNTFEALLFNGTAIVQNNIFDNFKSAMTASGAAAVVSEDTNLFIALDTDPQVLSGAVINRGGSDQTVSSPRFVDSAVFNYHLEASSPAIDLGADMGILTDADGNQRLYGAGVDVGAYEYQGVGLPSIGITKSGPPYAAATGSTPFILTVYNEGSSTQSDLQVVEQLPAGATYVTGSASNGGVYDNGTLTWNLAPLAPYAKTMLQYSVTASQTLVSSSYTVTSLSNPAITASGLTLTTPYEAGITALGFFPYPDGFSVQNYTDSIDSDTTIEDMVTTFGAANVCKTQNPCVLNASAEAYRQFMTTRSGGHCFGLAMGSLWLYDRADVSPGDYQSGAITTFDLNKSNSRDLIQLFYYTQMQTPVSTDLPTHTASSGAAAMVDTLKANFADPNATDRYELNFFRMDRTGGHAVTPYVVKQIDAETYWVYVYDNNYPNNFDRVFKVDYANNSWVYEGGATHPGAPVSSYNGDATVPNNIQLKSLRVFESFPKKCTSSNACAPAPVEAPAAAETLAAMANSTTAEAPAYDFQLDGEGYLMVTRSDGLRAGVDASGQFIAEIPGAEETEMVSGDGLNVPNIIHISHEAGMSYTLSITDRLNAFGNPSATANVNIFSAGFVTRLKGLKLDSPIQVVADPDDPNPPTAVQPGSNDVVSITFDGDNHSLSFTSSALDSDTPSLGMAIGQYGQPDFTFEIGGAQMASGRTLTVAIDPTTGKLTVNNDDPAANTYNIAVERINLDGSKTTYAGTADEETSGITVDLGPSWTGGEPPIHPTNNAPAAAANAYNILANTALTVIAPGLLGNDTDADGDALTAVKVTEPAHGTLTLNSDGSFTYIPASNYAGTDNFTYKANDGKADSDAATVTIIITYTFTGFFQPVDDLPIENLAKAGSSIPVKFSLGGNMGLSIFGPGSPSSKQVSCPGGSTPLDTIETTTTSNSRLTYDTATGQYTYVWKTEKGWANTCRLFTIAFADGSKQEALFKFNK